MSNEVRCRYVVVAVPESFAMELAEGKTDPRMTGKCRVIDGPEAGKEIPFSGSLSTKDFTTRDGRIGTPAGITMETLRALGWSGNDLSDLVGLGSVKTDAVGKDHSFEGRDGKVVNTIQYSFYPARVRPTLRAEDQRAFAAKFKAIAAGLKDKVVAVSDDNRAPVELPAARTDLGTAPSNSDVGGADSLF